MEKCTTAWCTSGLPGTVKVVENIGDGCWNLTICQQCADDFGAKDGDDLMAEPIYSRTLKANPAHPDAPGGEGNEK